VPAGPHAILWPAFALVALTFVVWLRMYHVRIREMRRLRIDPQSVATSAQASGRFVDTRASDNLRNLFELPVLFYALVSVALATGTTPDWLVTGAWCFVALRYVHSVIHCSYNRVMHRLAAFALGALVLTGLWVGLLMNVLRKPGA